MCGSVSCVSTGILPIWSHICAILSITQAALIIKNNYVVNQKDFLTIIDPIGRNLLAISLGRDLLGIAAVVTLVGLGILNPFSAVAIGVGAALLVSVIISSVAIGMINHVGPRQTYLFAANLRNPRGVPQS